MARRIVWQDVDIRIYIDNEEKAEYFATSVEWSESIEVDKARYQGAKTPSLDAIYNGGRGSIEFVLQDGWGDPREVFEDQVEHLKDRTPGGIIRIVVSRRAPTTGIREAHRFDGVIVTPTDRASDTQRWGQSWAFEYEDSKRVN